MGIFFPEAGYGIANAFNGFFKTESIILLIVQDAVVLVCYMLQRSERFRQFGRRISLSDQHRVMAGGNRKLIAVVAVLSLAASFCIAGYFIDRIESVMSWHGIEMNETTSYDIVHLQIQFLMGVISLFAIIMLIALLWTKNFNYLYYEARLDGLTGLPGRSQFFMQGENMIRNMKCEEGKTGCFAILDVDRFKEINDRYGHPEGDRVLGEVADALKETMGRSGIVGRLGGDEFVALVCHPMEKEQTDGLLEELRNRISEITVDGRSVSCSMGWVPVREESDMESLYKSADSLLYEEKKRGGVRAAERDSAS